MSKVVAVGRTRFRSDNVAWVVCQGLSRRQRFCKYALIIAGFAFWTALAHAKGSWMTLEAVLGFFPILVALGMRTTARLASTGDSSDSYEERLLQPGRPFQELADSLREDYLEVESSYGNYRYLLNPTQIRWYRPWLQADLRPLKLVLLFGSYAALIASEFHLPPLPGLELLGLFRYQAGTAPMLAALSAGIAFLAVLTIAFSLRRGLQLSCEGGVREEIFLYEADRPRVLDALETCWSRPVAAST